MLSDWEERQLADIERDLRSDKALGRVLGTPTEYERRRLEFTRHFYPTGYYLCALAYMVAVMGSGRWLTLVGALLVASVAWLVVEVRALPERSQR